jgi:hypothetical protein
MSMPFQDPSTVRFGVELSRKRDEEACPSAPADFMDDRSTDAFRREMNVMAADPEIRAENARIAHEFALTEFDGLKNY